MKGKTYYNNTSFLDLLFNFLLATTILLVIAVLHIVIEQNKADIKTQAEFVVTVTWDKHKDIDIDTWIEDPDGLMLWYKQKEIGIMHLDRDDRGHSGDDYVLRQGEVYYNPNQEIVTIRGIKSGEWIINVHCFRILTEAEMPVDVDITVIKLNPKADTVLHKKITFKRKWQQMTIARIKISDKGEVLVVEDGPAKDLIQDKISNAEMPTGTTSEMNMAP